MNPLDRLLDIEARLNAGTVSIDQACSELFTGPKPWHTPWWKEQRKAKLASACATCGSTEPPLVLQHTWQPISWEQALRQVGPPNWDWWKEQHPIPRLERPPRPMANRPVCPHCGSIRVYARKRTKDWACEAGKSGRPHERHEDFIFPEPKIELRPDNVAIRRQNEALRQEYEKLRSANWQAWLQSPEAAENRLNALRLCMAESKRYLSFADTKTLCRRCAASEDHRHIRTSLREAKDRRQAKYWAELDSIE